MVYRCPNCKGSEIRYDYSSKMAICRKCGEPLRNFQRDVGVRGLDYLGKFPTMKVLLGKWIEKQISKEQHPLLRYLLKGEPDWNKINGVKNQGKGADVHIKVDGLQNHHNHLVNLEKCLSALRDEPRISKFLKHLKNPNSFWQGYAEVECTALFKRKFGKVAIEPHLSTCKNVDYNFSLEKKLIFVEVAAPKMGQKFEDVFLKHVRNTKKTVAFFDLPDSRDRVKDAILHQFLHFTNSGVPGLIIYDVSKCEFDGKDVSERLKGTSFLVVYTRKDTGESASQVKRDPDSVLINDPEIENLGGIICYKRDFDLEGRPVYTVNIIGIVFPIETMREVGQAFV